MPAWLPLLLLFPAGMVAGVVNTLAGGGSFLTLPLLMLYGLPPQAANGSNRVAILLQTAYASRVYDVHERLDRRALSRLLAVMLPGALAGAYLASAISPAAFKQAMGWVFLGFVVLVALKRHRLLSSATEPRVAGVGAAVAFFSVGFYGGFLQAGVGILLLLSMATFLGRDLARANGLKQAVVALWTLPAVLWFAYCGQVDWLAGLVLGAGNVVGAHFGARLAIAKGSPLILAALITVMLATALALLWPG